MTVDDALDAADRFNQFDYDPVMRTLADEIRRLRALLPDEREREALAFVSAYLWSRGGGSHYEEAIGVINRLLAASHSEGSGT